MTIFESRSSRLASAVGLMLLLAMAVSLVMIVPAEAKRRDSIPPTFAGLKSAITCIPGPIGGGRTTSYNLSWDSATDNVTPSRKIVYDVYQADAPGAEDFSTPTYTTSRRSSPSSASALVRKRPPGGRLRSSAGGWRGRYGLASLGRRQSPLR